VNRTAESGPARADAGFTLIELMIAMVILAIVLGALAPGFYNALASASVSGQRNTADSLAMSELQQMQAAPYAEVGFYSSQSIPPTCPPGTVLLGSTPPSSGFVLAPTSVARVATTSFAITRCVDWSNDNVAGCTDDFKRTEVVVSWPAADPKDSVQQVSAVYPGGLSSCAPASTTTSSTSTTVLSGAPGTPTNLTATDPSDSTGSSTIDLVWGAPTGGVAVDHYAVEYNTTGNFSAPGDYATLTTANPPSTFFGVPGLTAGSTYYFEVLAVSAGGVDSPPAGPVSATTSTGSTTTTTIGGGPVSTTTPTTVAACSVTQINVTPASGVVDKSGQLVNASTFSVSVNASSGCASVTVVYSDGGTSGTTSLSGSGGQLNGTVGSASTTWAVGTASFTVYVGGIPYSPTTEELVNICQERGRSGKC
jgi:prepilin-type N-terminal cleavage/methylation domain-containing protein